MSTSHDCLAQMLADGEPGVCSLAFDVMLMKDMQPGEYGSPEHMEVPYGYLTGMRDFV